MKFFSVFFCIILKYYLKKSGHRLCGGNITILFTRVNTVHAKFASHVNIKQQSSSVIFSAVLPYISFFSWFLLHSELKIFHQRQSSGRKRQDDATLHLKARRAWRVWVTVVSCAAMDAHVVVCASKLFLLVVTLVVTPASRKYLIRSTAFDYERFLVSAFPPEEHRETFSLAGFGAGVARIAAAARTSHALLGSFHWRLGHGIECHKHDAHNKETLHGFAIRVIVEWDFFAACCLVGCDMPTALWGYDLCRLRWINFTILENADCPSVWRNTHSSRFRDPPKKL